MSELGKIKTLFVKNAKQMWRDKVRILSMLFFPLVMIGLFGSAVGSETTEISTAVVYTEDSDTGQKVLQGFHAAKTFKVKKRVGSINAGKEMISEGKIDTLIIIPPDLQKTIKSGRTGSIRIMVDEANPQIAQTAQVVSREIIQKTSTQLSANFIQGINQNQAKISEYLHNLEKGTQNIKRVIQTQRKRLEETNRIINQSSYSLEELSSSLRKVNDSLEKLSQGGSSLSFEKEPQDLSSLKNLVSETKLLVRNTNISPENKKRILENLTILGEGLDQADKNLKTYSTVISNLTKNIEKIKEGTQEIQQPIEKVQEETQSINQALEKSERSLEQAEYLSEKTSESVEKLGNEIGRAGNNLEKTISDNPSFLSNPIKYVREVAYGKDLEYIDFLAPGIIALTIFMGSVMGLGRAVAGEREKGSLTRLFLTPTSSMTIILGTGLFYSGFEFLRALILLFASILLFDLTIVGSLSLVLLILAIHAVGSVGLGLFLSSRLKNEEQFRAVTMPVVMPMMFISGVFFPIQNMPSWLQTLSKVMPLRYAANALRGIMVRDLGLPMISQDFAFLVIFALITLTLGGIFFKREVMT